MSLTFVPFPLISSMRRSFSFNSNQKCYEVSQEVQFTTSSSNNSMGKYIVLKQFPRTILCYKPCFKFSNISIFGSGALLK